jgi:hypothetical protein
VLVADGLADVLHYGHEDDVLVPVGDGAGESVHPYKVRYDLTLQLYMLSVYAPELEERVSSAQVLADRR